MPSGIFGPRAPSYPLPSYSNRSFQPAYDPSSPAPYPPSYSARISSRFQPYSTYAAHPNLPAYSQPTYSQAVHTQPAYSQPPVFQKYTTAPQAYYNAPYQSNMITSPGYSGSLPYYTSSFYPPVSQYSGGMSSHGLEAVLVAILVLVSLDLIIVRPLKD